MDSVIKTLQNNGLNHPARVKRIIQDAIKFYNLDLRGLTVFTETGSRYFVVTPVIAALSGATVFALVRDSRYGKKEDIKRYTLDFANFCTVSGSLTIIHEKNPEIIKKAHIVTNLGFVRPIDKEFIDSMNKKSVIPYMYETWEQRESDVDLAVCYERGIPVLGTNESFPGRQVFNYSGPLCIKMLIEIDIEVLSSKIVIVSNDKFGVVIWKYLSALGADAYLVGDLLSLSNRQYLNNCDAVIIADYHAKTPIIGGDNAQISVSDLISYSESVSIINFVGPFDIQALVNGGIPYAPQVQSGMTMGKNPC